MKLTHLARRFARALWPGSPHPVDVAWVEHILQPNELELWGALPAYERRYSIRVARTVETLLTGTPYADDDRWLAAALLHDTGKLDSDFGVSGRVIATTVGAMVSDRRVDRWLETEGTRRRIALYLRHDDCGERRLRSVGARAEAVCWAGAHHGRDRWEATGIPDVVADALERADNI